MKKGSKKATSKSKRETKKVAELQQVQVGLAEREANTLVIGIDLGDRTSTYCVRTLGQEVVLEGSVATTAVAMFEAFRPLRRQRMVIETGTHSGPTNGRRDNAAI